MDFRLWWDNNNITNKQQKRISKLEFSSMLWNIGLVHNFFKFARSIICIKPQYNIVSLPQETESLENYETISFLLYKYEGVSLFKFTLKWLKRIKERVGRVSFIYYN